MQGGSGMVESDVEAETVPVRPAPFHRPPAARGCFQPDRCKCRVPTVPGSAADQFEHRILLVVEQQLDEPDERSDTDGRRRRRRPVAVHGPERADRADGNVVGHLHSATRECERRQGGEADEHVLGDEHGDKLERHDPKRHAGSDPGRGPRPGTVFRRLGPVAKLESERAGEAGVEGHREVDPSCSDERECRHQGRQPR